MSSEYIYGRRPVYETIRAGRRTVHRLLIAQGTDPAEVLTAITQLAADRGTLVETVPRGRLNDLIQHTGHQGVVLETGAYHYASIDDCLNAARLSGQPSFFLLLDLIQDIQNVGTLIRAAEAVGVHGIIIQERRAPGVTPAVVNASSGAVEHMNVVQVTNLSRAIEELKSHDIWVAGLDMDAAATRYDQARLDGALALVVGSEGEGLRRLVREKCDFIVRLPMQGKVDSLNAATAGSIILYATWQSRGFAGAVIPR